MTATPQRGPRVLYGLVGLVLVVAVGVYGAGLLLGEGRPEPAPADDGPPPGWGRVVLGAPSGAPPRPRPGPVDADPLEQPPVVGPDGAPVSPPGPGPDGYGSDPGPAPEPPAPPPERYPADLELVVRSGQSLSKIVAESYGRSTPDLVRRLAAYNGLADPDRLRAGQRLRVPVREKLLASTP